MSQYMVLIYEDPAAYQAGGQGLVDEVMKGHQDFGNTHGAQLAGGNALQGIDTATSLRRGADGSISISDGPFVETKEAIGGYYVVEARDLDEAIAIASTIPAPGGGLEVRPVMVFD